MSAGPAETPDPYAVELALAAALAQVTDGHTEEIARAWAVAWAEVAGDLQDALEVILAADGRVNVMAIVRYDRLARILAGIADQLEDLVSELGVLVEDDLVEVLGMATEGSLALIRAQLPDGQTLPVRPVLPDALRAIVERVTQQITSTALPVATETYALIQRELTRGVAAGDNPRETALRMVQRAEDRWNFGRTRAETIARTEILDAYREAARVQQDQHADILAGWVWLAHLGPRTCRSCLSMHGQVFGLEVPGPDDHQQGRCSRCPIVRGADGEADLSWVPSAEDHFAGLPEEDQRAILGRRGYDAWVAGDFPLEDWTKRRETDGWRGSQVPAAPRDPDAGTGRSGGGTVPPVSGGDGGGPEDPDEIAARLDDHYADWLDNLSDDQQQAIIAWQGTDRHYIAMQSAVRDGTADDILRSEVSALLDAIEAGRLPEAVHAWRGIRSSTRVFRLPAADLDELVDRTFTLDGFFGVTLDQQIALDEFTVPPLAGGPVLMKVSIAAGTPAAWVAAAGDPDHRRQLELLLAGPIRVRIVSLAYDGDLPILEVEVISP